MNVANESGATPLHFAARKDNIETVKLLLAHGANKKARAGNGAMPWEGASSETRVLCGGPSNAMHAAVKAQDLPQLKALLADEANDIIELDARGRVRVQTGDEGWPSC